ncbi:very short patch repair endonuclease [Hydrogenophaga sp.]|jgi:DNA mismatch endonuclease (patch repair protein)|uniref:very short patch repair endonuclease n=1 Tax=Hydrogenophaga sp. TaxID=1904254 RepID=UPI003F7289A3
MRKDRTPSKVGAAALPYIQVAPETRRRMLAVRGQDTAPELRVRRVLHGMGYRFRLHRKDLPGTPDVVLPRHRKIVLVHGCFWHGHEDCKRATRPVNNAVTWSAKIEGNRRRDKRNIDALSALGWGVLVVWECEVRDTPRLEARLRAFLEG